MQLATEINIYRPAIVYIFVNADTVLDKTDEILEALTRKFFSRYNINLIVLVGDVQLNGKFILDFTSY
jgi:hypothetical protein